jgi:DNA-binding transcriptional ArsR family regulator
MSDPRVALLRELADPVRLRVADRLGHAGPATVSRLAAELGVSLPQLSNHLRRLREAGLVRVERTGRNAVYELADPGLEALLPLLDRLTGRVTPASEPRTAVASRTCYDHLAGPLGVALYAALRGRDAVRDRVDGMVDLGPAAAAVFDGLGVDVAAVEPGRRRFAFECLDATEHAPHLAGALGDALAGALIDRGWVSREPGGRTIALTARGAGGLRRVLGLELGTPGRTGARAARPGTGHG